MPHPIIDRALIRRYFQERIATSQLEVRNANYNAAYLQLHNSIQYRHCSDPERIALFSQYADVCKTQYSDIMARTGTNPDIQQELNYLYTNGMQYLNTAEQICKTDNSFYKEQYNCAMMRAQWTHTHVNYDAAIPIYAEAYKLTQGPEIQGVRRVEQHEVGFSRGRPIGTDNIQNCCILILRDPATGLTGLAHVDSHTTADSITNALLSQFNPHHQVEVYLFGSGFEGWEHLLNPPPGFQGSVQPAYMLSILQNQRLGRGDEYTLVAQRNILAVLSELEVYTRGKNQWVIHSADIGNRRDAAITGIIFDPQVPFNPQATQDPITITHGRPVDPNPHYNESLSDVTMGLPTGNGHTPLKVTCYQNGQRPALVLNQYQLATLWNRYGQNNAFCCYLDQLKGDLSPALSAASAGQYQNFSEPQRGYLIQAQRDLLMAVHAAWKGVRDSHVLYGFPALIFGLAPLQITPPLSSANLKRTEKTILCDAAGIEPDAKGKRLYNLETRLLAVNEDNASVGRVLSKAQAKEDPVRPDIPARPHEQGSVQIMPESDHLTQHGDHVAGLIAQIQSGGVAKGTVIAMERKEEGKHLGMRDVRLLGQVLKHNENLPTEKQIKLPPEIVGSPLYHDASLYNACQQKGITVIGMEGKGLSVSKESPAHLEARDTHMTATIEAHTKAGQNVIVLVGKAHQASLQERLGDLVSDHAPTGHTLQVEEVEALVRLGDARIQDLQHHATNGTPSNSAITKAWETFEKENPKLAEELGTSIDPKHPHSHANPSTSPHHSPDIPSH